LERFLLKYDKPGKRMRTIAFLLYDHIAGIDTLFYTLSSGGVLIAPDRRDPRSICRLIESCRAEVLPTSPTFLNLLSISGEYADFDLSSLKIVTYGSEPMNQSTLDRVQRVFSSAQILQKYGTSEFGSPRSRSRGRDSLWLEFDADGMQTRVINGMLQVKSDTAMLGYLNAPSPFDEEGWYRTGDIVECEGDWVHIRGRECEIINVGGEKVYPQEVEAVILELEFVKDAIVRGKSNPITGQIVTAEINVRRSIDEQVAWREVRKHCRARLAPHKVPVRVMLSEEALTTDRQKKIRHERPK
jgi:acyl-coenzyme A synthetase/AMP-(fatty) acid ligase